MRGETDRWLSIPRNSLEIGLPIPRDRAGRGDTIPIIRLGQQRRVFSNPGRCIYTGAVTAVWRRSAAVPLTLHGVLLVSIRRHDRTLGFLPVFSLCLYPSSILSPFLAPVSEFLPMANQSQKPATSLTPTPIAAYQINPDYISCSLRRRRPSFVYPLTFSIFMESKSSSSYLCAGISRSKADVISGCYGIYNRKETGQACS